MSEYRVVQLGGVVERLMAPVLKTGRAKALVGSNPTPSAINFGLRIVDFELLVEATSQRRTLRGAQ